MCVGSNPGAPTSRRATVFKLVNFSQPRVSHRHTRILVPPYGSAGSVSDLERLLNNL